MNMNQFGLDPGLAADLQSHKDWEAGELRLFFFDIDLAGEELLAAKELLSGEETVRASRLKFRRDQDRFIAGRATLRGILGELLGEAPEALRFEYSERGKPRLAESDTWMDLRFNLSHCGGKALLAVAEGVDLGVDLECRRTDLTFEQISEIAFLEKERDWLRAQDPLLKASAFFRLWTYKEAVLKVHGEGLAAGLRKYCVLPRGEFDASVWDAEAKRQLPGWQLRSFCPWPGYHAAIAAQGNPLPRKWAICPSLPKL